MKTKTSRHHNLKGGTAKIAIIFSRFNDGIGKTLYNNTVNHLLALGVPQKNIKTFRIAGALEAPLAAKLIATKKKFHAIIALGIIIRGDTYHFELVCQESYRGLMNVSLASQTPIIFGILTVENEQQALERVDSKKLNKGLEFAETALEMALFVSENKA